MNRKIVFTDLDDTLLNFNKEISPGNRAVLEETLRQGHVIAITTGRATPSAVAMAKYLGLVGKNCYLISFNGSQIYDLENHTFLFRTGLPLPMVRFLFDQAHAFGISVQTYTDEGVLLEKDGYDIKQYMQIQKNLTYRVVEDVTKELTEPVPKVLVADFRHPERITDFRQILEPLLSGRADTFLSHPELLELMPPGINKGQAIRQLCQHLKIPLENSVAAGDAENDLSMILAAHVGCAMCNGEEAVKQAADYVTERDCNHDGWAEILHKFVLEDA